MEASRLIVKSPVYAFFRRIKDLMEYLKILIKKKGEGRTKSYCISPYKTATTYVAGAMSGNYKAEHEPFQHLTLKNIQNINFLKARSEYLSLDIECSGFFAGKLDLIRSYDSNARILMVYRPFEKWVKSFINHAKYLSGRMHDVYMHRMVFDSILEARVEDFHDLDKSEKLRIMERLFVYYESSFLQGSSDKKCLIVPLKYLDESWDAVLAFLNLEKRAIDKHAWKRESKLKNDFDFRSLIAEAHLTERENRLNLMVEEHWQKFMKDSRANIATDILNKESS